MAEGAEGAAAAGTAAAAPAAGAEAGAAAAPAAAPASGAPANGQDQSGQGGQGNALDFQGDQTATSTGGEGQILGRFNSQAELEADWKKQNDMLRGRVGEMPDEALREAAVARGMITEVPEAYDFNAAVGNSGVTWKSRDEAPEAFDQITGALKGAGFTQDHLNAAMPLVQSIVEEAVREFSSQVDTKAEKGKLSGEWGNETDTRGRAVRDWATANLPSEIFYKPLGATAEGIKFLEGVMRGEKGAQPINGTTRAGFDPTKIDAQLAEMRQSDAYRSGLHPDHQAIHQRYDELLAQKMKARP